MAYPEEIEKAYKHLTILQEEYKDCTKCSLAETRTKVVFGVGTIGKIMVIAEAPGEVEDKTGFPLVGQSGQILDYLLAKSSDDKELHRLAKSFPANKIDRFGWSWPGFQEAKQLLLQEVFYTNTVLCRPPDNRNPTNNEIKACTDRLLKTIYRVDPIIIIAAGKISLETLLGKKVASINKLCGRLVDITIPGEVVDLVYPIMPILHPAHLARNPDLGKKNGFWETTLQSLITVRKIVENYEGLS